MSVLIKNGYCINSQKEGYFDVLIEGNRIKTIDNNIKIETDYVIDAKECLVMPTFCNAHTHLAMSLFRGLADDLELMEWLTKHIFPAEAKYVSADMVYKCSKLSMLEAIRSGTSCFLDMYFFEEKVAEAAIEVGMRGVVTEGIIDFPTPDCSDAKEAIEKTKSLKEEFKNEPLIRVGFGPHSTYTLSFDSLKMVADALEEDDVVHIHVNESSSEIEAVLKDKGKRPIDVLIDIGLLSRNTFMAHCVKSSDKDIEKMKAYNANVINVPQSNFKLASGIAPIEKMINKGVNVFIGTDGSASNNNLDMIEEFRTSSLVQKVEFGQKAMDAKTTLKIASNFNGLFDDVGFLKEGNVADIVVMSLNDLEAVPIYNPYSFVVYAANSRAVRDVIINGKVILKDREFVCIDENRVKFEVKELAKKLGAL
ncbi:amidohydrolase [Hippea maritima]|uniref:S-adenosylhomocysteine deaminase n=1 Tax=Hippea maritima (strain ATCC 700847 / DSM 10411 / MH2) TaxID=760142 RepID=F2LWH2_HIPMA|nr:amidohydrolase [Hippea maritima]AEA34081.1 S-adenosylhomocysteine deaminase [Hippea maritima DSM 10411]